MTAELEAADVLERAADALFVRGRSRSFTKAPDGSVCVRGAIGLALTGRTEDGWHNAAYQVVLRLGAYVGPNMEWGFSVTQWNSDATDGDVLDALKGCAKSLREVES